MRHSSIKAKGTAAEILIYEEIGESFFGGLGAKAFREQIGALPKDVTSLTVRINSEGGSVFEGMAIYNTLKDHPAKKDVIIDGIAASIATVIAMAGDTITIQPTATMMIHNASGVVRGDCNSLRKVADLLEMINGQMAVAYARSGKTEADILSVMNGETWYTAQGAVEAGWVDALVAQPLKLAACMKDFDLSKAPDWVQDVQAMSADNAACTCSCEPCLGGDCGSCDHDGCRCEGCDCDQQTTAKAAENAKNELKSTDIQQYALMAARNRELSLRLAELG